MNLYNKLIHILVLIANLYLFRSPIGVTELILVWRYPVGTIEQDDVHYVTLIHYLDSYHITVGLPRPVIKNE